MEDARGCRGGQAAQGHLNHQVESGACCRVVPLPFDVVQARLSRRRRCCVLVHELKINASANISSWKVLIGADSSLKISAVPCEDP